jgi:stage II sporulation protein D
VQNHTGKDLKMFKRTLLFLVLFLLILPSCKTTNLYRSDKVKHIYSKKNANDTVKIGIVLNTNSVSVGASREFYVFDAKNKKIRFSKGFTTVSAFNNKIKVGNSILHAPVKIKASNQMISVNNKIYRGHLSIVGSGNKANVINVLPIEYYLRGVLPKEVSASWKKEALKAQAVISRTYTIKNISKHSAQGFDLCSTVHCQVYDGANSEKSSCSEAVDETSGEILTFEGELAQTVFHANCGGHTDDPSYIWNMKETPVYLKGVKCKYHSNSPHTYWEVSVPENFIVNKLSSHKIGKIRSIKVKGTTATGAAKKIEINHSKGILLLNAYAFRLAIDPSKIKSHMFTSIKNLGNNFYFAGKGWGHKVGLCQWGAKDMSENGSDYKQILLHYYPKTKLKYFSNK